MFDLAMGVAGSHALIQTFLEGGAVACCSRQLQNVDRRCCTPCPPYPPSAPLRESLPSGAGEPRLSIDPDPDFDFDFGICGYQRIQPPHQTEGHTTIRGLHAVPDTVHYVVFLTSGSLKLDQLAKRD